MTPPEILIRFRGRRLLWMFLPFLLMLGLSFALHPGDWLTLSVMGQVYWVGIAIVYVLIFYLMPRYMTLRFSAEGLEIKYVVSSRHYRWDQIENPRCRDNPFGRVIVFDLVGSAARTGLGGLAKAANGYDVSLLDAYEYSANDVVALMMAWKAYAAQAQAL